MISTPFFSEQFWCYHNSGCIIFRFWCSNKTIEQNYHQQHWQVLQYLCKWKFYERFDSMFRSYSLRVGSNGENYSKFRFHRNTFPVLLHVKLVVFSCFTSVYYVNVKILLICFVHKPCVKSDDENQYRKWMGNLSRTNFYTYPYTKLLKCF